MLLDVEGFLVRGRVSSTELASSDSKRSKIRKIRFEMGGDNSKTREAVHEIKAANGLKASCNLEVKKGKVFYNDEFLN